MIVESYLAGRLRDTRVGDTVVLYLDRPYGSLRVTIAENGKCDVEQIDADGDSRRHVVLNLDEHAAAPADLFAELNPLADVPAIKQEAGIGPVPNPLYHVPSSD